MPSTTIIPAETIQKLPTTRNIAGQHYLLRGGQLSPAPGGHSPHTHHLVINAFSRFSPPPRKQQDHAANHNPSTFYMKLLLDLCALCFSLGKIHHGFSPRSEAGQKDSFGSFSVRVVIPAAKRLFTYAVDENLFFEFYGSSSEYSKLDVLKGIWSRKFTSKGSKSVK
jgi:hypothetical protein